MCNEFVGKDGGVDVEVDEVDGNGRNFGLDDAPQRVGEG